jgi:hypothetical protein
MSKKTILTVAVVGVLVAFVFVAAAQGTKPKIQGETITKTFSQTAPCANVTIALTLPTGSDPAEVSESLFAALQPIPGMTTATLNAQASSIDVGFCESSASEDTIRQALLPTGLVAEASAGQPETVE